MQTQLETGKQPENVEIDTRLSIISPLMLNGTPHSFYDLVQNNKQIVLNKWILSITLLPRIQVPALIYVAKAKVHALK